MPEIIYSLCALTALLCTWQLLKGYWRARYRLLLWGGLCFSVLTVNNVLLLVDKVLWPYNDLSLWRLAAGVLAMSILLYGLIWDTE